MARIGLVLGAGGTVGHAFHAGVLAALEEDGGWDPRGSEVIVGTSAGSVVAALVRAGLSASDLLARAEDRPLSESGARLLPGRPPRGVGSAASPRRRATSLRPAAPGRFLGAALRPWEARLGTLAAALLPEGSVPTDVVAAPLERLYGSSWPTSAFWVTAVALDRGRRVVFGRHGAPQATVAEAVAASCAIPGFFEPVKIAGTRYVDGGSHSPSNADLLASVPLDLVVISSPMSTARGVVRMTPDAAVRRASRAYLSVEVATLERRGIPVVTFQPTAEDQDVMGPNAMDFRRRSAVAAQARRATLRRLRRPELRRAYSVLFDR